VCVSVSVSHARHGRVCVRVRWTVAMRCGVGVVRVGCNECVCGACVCVCECVCVSVCVSM
jgi:hypothetical protein